METKKQDEAIWCEAGETSDVQRGRRAYIAAQAAKGEGREVRHGCVLYTRSPALLIYSLPHRLNLTWT